jgi:hypothetical protein
LARDEVRDPPDNLSLHQSSVTISQSQARQPSTIAIDTAYGAMVLVCVLACAGFVLTILVFFPGYLTRDATYVHTYVQTGYLGDWQSPLMTIVWRLIDPISPGSGSVFLLVATLYWRKRPADRAFHAPLAHEIVCPLIGKLRGTHDERYGAFGS